jgi:membrane dipeptidase
LEAMADLGFALDLSHMNEVSTLTALDTYRGVIVATHSNARARIKVGSGDRYPTDGNGERHLSDLAIRRLVERDGVMGLLPYNRFLVTDWTPENGRHTVKLEMLAGHVDHICQIAGDARHVGIGTDFDGGFGYPAVPEEIDTVADLQKLAGVLGNHGYSGEDIAGILGGNWRRMLERTLPEA